MTSKGKQHEEGSGSASSRSGLRTIAQQSQLDFELDFFGGILQRHPNYVDVLKVMGSNLTQKKQYREGLEVDRRLVQLRPGDPLAYYNLACSYALLGRTEWAIKTLQRAVQLGYRDFRYMKKDRDLDSIRNDPRYRQLLQEYEQR